MRWGTHPRQRLDSSLRWKEPVGGQGCEVPRLRRERRSLSQGSDGWGLIPGPIWPCLASFTPTVEAGNGATVASFGPPLTRRHWASWLWLRPWLASSGVARRGETFKSVAFGCISLHSLSSTRGQGCVQLPHSRLQRQSPTDGHDSSLNSLETTTHRPMSGRSLRRAMAQWVCRASAQETTRLRSNLRPATNGSRAGRGDGAMGNCRDHAEGGDCSTLRSVEALGGPAGSRLTPRAILARR